MSQCRRKIVVTGIGLTTPFSGKSITDDWSLLIAGKSPRRKIDLFDVSTSRCKEAAYASSLDLDSFSSRALALASPALEQALDQANLLNDDLKVSIPHLPFSISTTAGAMAFGERFVREILKGEKRNLLKTIEPYQGQQQLLSLQQKFAIDGRSQILCNACSSGANAIGHGYDWIKAGWSECVIVGGYEALTELLFYGFDSLQSLAPESCKSFDQHRDGLMLGEGAGFLILESEEHARKRGVQILAELRGYGQSTDRHHLTQPHPEGIALTKAMIEALQDSGISPSEVGYLNAHGTGTPMNDGAEFASYQNAWRNLGAPTLDSLKISSTKASIGHTLGAAGAIEAIFSILALREGIAPPQIHTTTPLPGMEKLLVQPNAPRADWRATMSVNLGFGGSNAALLFVSTP